MAKTSIFHGFGGSWLQISKEIAGNTWALTSWGPLVMNAAFFRGWNTTGRYISGLFHKPRNFRIPMHLNPSVCHSSCHWWVLLHVAWYSSCWINHEILAAKPKKTPIKRWCFLLRCLPTVRIIGPSKKEWRVKSAWCFGVLFGSPVTTSDLRSDLRSHDSWGTWMSQEVRING